jgi:hypothetical protein
MFGSMFCEIKSYNVLALSFLLKMTKIGSNNKGYCCWHLMKTIPKNSVIHQLR